MQPQRSKTHIFKYFIGLSTVIILRLIPHPPSFQPIMANMMPYSKNWGKFSGCMFGVLSILSYDLLTGTLGKWSLLTVGAYGLLGILSGIFFKQRKSSVKNYVTFAILGTLIYDIITGFGVGMLIFNQGFYQTLTGQIPFTIQSMLGNIVFSSILSPVIYKWILKNPKLEDVYILQKLNLAK